MTQAATPSVKENKEFKAVKLVEFQSAARFPGGFTEASLNIEKQKKFEMYWVKGEGLLVKTPHGDAFVPDTNIKSCWFK